MIQYLKHFLCIVLFFRIVSGYAQIGPNLSAGAEGIVYKQGELDTQVVLDIIATKRGEIKTELGKRLILDKLEGGSFTFYNYAEKSLNLIFSENSKQVVTKEFMKNSTELILVYALSEYLLQDMTSRASEDDLLFAEERGLLGLIYSQMDLDAVPFLASRFIPSYYGSNVSLKSEINRISLNLFDSLDLIQSNDKQFSKLSTRNDDISSMTSVQGDYLLKPELTALLKNHKSNYKEGKNKYYTPASMLVDLVYDVCANNKLIQSVGLFQSNYSSEERYKALSKYWYFDKPGFQFIFKYLEDYRPRVEKTVNCLFAYYGLLKEWRNVYENQSKFQSVLATGQLREQDIEKEVVQIKTDILAMTNAPVSLESNQLYEDEVYAIDQILDLPLLLPQSNENRRIPKFTLDVAYLLKKDIIPILSSLNSRSGRYTSVLVKLNHLHSLLTQHATKYFADEESDVRNYITSVTNYLPLLDIINNLDEVDSYDKIFKFMTGLMETFGDPRTQAVVQAITTGVDRYTTIDTEGNNISMDVEGMAGDVYERFAKNQQAPLTILFTVGVSHNAAKGANVRFADEQGDDSDYSQFVSEKIGLKFNLIDWNRRRSFNVNSFQPGTKREWQYKRSMRQAGRQFVNPIVNNFHLMTYGSGLLYKINALNSAQEFKKPFFGIGAGVTFFNGLNCNVSLASINNLQFCKTFWSFSFDVAITEYLSALKGRKK